MWLLIAKQHSLNPRAESKDVNTVPLIYPVSCFKLQSVPHRWDEDTKSEHYKQNFYISKSIQIPVLSAVQKNTNPNSLQQQENALDGEAYAYNGKNLPWCILSYARLEEALLKLKTKQTRFVKEISGSLKKSSQVPGNLLSKMSITHLSCFTVLVKWQPYA